MANPVVVAVMATLGLLSSTLALAEVTDGVVSVMPANLAAPVVVDDLAANAPAEAISEDSAQAQPLPADEPDTLAALVAQADVDDTLDAEERCLATAIYYEARSESLTGQLAVAHVVLERARSGRFPTSLCGVITQPGQFGFVRGGRLPADPAHAGQWRTARAIAQIAMEGSWDNPVEGALFFHSSRVQPNWNRARMARIGGHIFYR